MFLDLPNKKYNIIYADPPWKYDCSADYPCKHNPTGAGGAVKHYKCLSLKEIKDLPIQKIIDYNSCFLFLWCTGPKMDWGIDIIKTWGFIYRTIPFVWIKCTNDRQRIRMDGIGSYTLNNAEYVLLGRIGKYKRNSTKIKQIIISPKQKHSKKPNIIRNNIVELIGNVPRIELFAREKSIGWDVWGDNIKTNTGFL